MQVALKSMIELEKVGNVVSVLPPQYQSSVKSRCVQEAERSPNLQFLVSKCHYFPQLCMVLELDL